MTLVMTTMSSPLGELRLHARGGALAGVYLPGQAAPVAARGDADVLARAAAQLAEYFAGTRRVFDLPLDARGTPFQERVWRALREIPYGATRSYGELARVLGCPTASRAPASPAPEAIARPGAPSARAVGAANGKNPLSIVVPCHRVIAASGALTGYAGGLPAKRWLLDHEQRAGAQVVAFSM